MGWNRVLAGQPHPMWAGVPDGSLLLFRAQLLRPAVGCAPQRGEADYGARFTAAVARDNIFATQFHPEKSADPAWPSTATSCTGIPDAFQTVSGRGRLPRSPPPFFTSMLLIPAIDLKDGHCVRLKQGDMDQATIFSEDPAAMARTWLDTGARRLHLVDLNGAFAGKPQNFAAIRSILKAVGDDIPVQLGGGIRDLDTIEKYIDGGLRYVIIGTAAVKNPGFLKDACTAFGGHIIVGLDAKDGKVATDGWSKLTGHEVVDLARKFEDWGVESIVYTDIGRDGMLTGINIEATVKLAQSLTIPVIASGGLSPWPTSRSCARSRTRASKA
jgi:phosphoribosylformimino-5-aminoimidazole carboxamide ribotide isomerase